jgi:hypothetical protein
MPKIGKSSGVLPRARQVRYRGFVGELPPGNILLLKAALLDGDPAVSAYRAWRSTFDLDSAASSQTALLPLLQDNLKRLGIEDPLADKFRGLRRYCWVRNLTALNFAKQFFLALDKKGVPFITLKGVALFADNFADRSLRPINDVDILVPESQLADAIDVLTAMNLRPSAFSRRDLILNRLGCRELVPSCNFVGPDGNIDLHWNALHLDRRPETDTQFWQDHRWSNLNGVPVRVLEPAHQLIYICAHAAHRNAGMAAELWPADAVLLIRDCKDLCVDRLIDEARRRRLSAIMAESLRFLALEFAISLEGAIPRLQASSSWAEQAEMRLRAIPPGDSHTKKSLFKLLDLSRSGISVTNFLKNRTGVNHFAPALVVASQIVLGRPRWLRRILGRDRYRILPQADRLPKVGDTLKLDGTEFDEALVAGWATPGATGVWTCGREATIACCVRGHDQNLALIVDGSTDIDETTELDKKAALQRIELWANDRRLASWRFRPSDESPLPARVVVPRGVIKDRNVLLVTFLIRRVSKDMRGLYLRSLALTSA